MGQGADAGREERGSRAGTVDPAAAVIPVEVLAAWLRRFQEAVAASREHLDELDAVLGDGDHGTNLDRGLRAAVAALDERPAAAQMVAGAAPAAPAAAGVGAAAPAASVEASTSGATADALFRQAGMALVSKTGGASGLLFGTFFLRLGAALGPVVTVSAAQFGAGLRAGLAGVAERGRARLGDKTMLDVLAPAVAAWDAATGLGAAAADAAGAVADAADAAGAACAAGRADAGEGATSIGAAAEAAADAAAEARDASAALAARTGRASYLGERSAGAVDPGGASAALLFRALAAAVAASGISSVPS